MNEDKDREDEKFYRIIREMINEAIRSGRFPGDGNFSITIAGGSLPIDIIPGGQDNLPEDNGPEIVKDIKPHTEIQNVGDSVVVSADLPGAKIEDTAITATDDSIVITSLADKIRYSARVKIPQIRKETLKYSLKNGLLEVSASIA